MLRFHDPTTLNLFWQTINELNTWKIYGSQVLGKLWNSWAVIISIKYNMQNHLFLWSWYTSFHSFHLNPFQRIKTLMIYRLQLNDKIFSWVEKWILLCTLTIKMFFLLKNSCTQTYNLKCYLCRRNIPE